MVDQLFGKHIIAVSQSSCTFETERAVMFIQKAVFDVQRRPIYENKNVSA